MIIAEIAKVKLETGLQTNTSQMVLRVEVEKVRNELKSLKRTIGDPLVHAVMKCQAFLSTEDGDKLFIYYN